MAKNFTDKKISKANISRREKIKSEGLDGYTMISVRLRNAEFLEFSSQIEEAGLTNNKALRIAARKIAGFLEADEQVKTDLKEILKELKAIGRNINQLTKIANTVNSVDHAGFLEARSALAPTFIKIQNQVQKLSSVSVRREDGLKMLEEAQS